ncbi:MAG: exodeoxyribonuclease V subunit alpha [Chitinispirillales bacterium]|jgi:exodeoxyribonuclease V alpha subunit|nr:exodeoxyribonuclease V subunit alpha [Chitinispirillales bacterium]
MQKHDKKQIEIIEDYLFAAGQITLLGKRQARMLSGLVADKTCSHEAQVILLLNLTALKRGAPRATPEFLLEPFSPDFLQLRIEKFSSNEKDEKSNWINITNNQELYQNIKNILEQALINPEKYSPIAGSPPKTPLSADSYPLLVIDSESRFFGFSRHWFAAVNVENAFREQLLSQAPFKPCDKTARAALHHVFQHNADFSNNTKFHYRQAAAAALALRTKLLILSGGPGTGKTKTILQILRVLLHAIPELDPEEIILCAPTGRAKARLEESINDSIDKQISIDPEFAKSKEARLRERRCKTLHNLLGIRPDGSSQFNNTSPLPYQVIVADEASMIDIYNFWALINSVSKTCRIILVGDMHQLPSVEAGAVLGDLTRQFSFYSSNPTLGTECGEWVGKMLDGITLDPNIDENGENSSLIIPQTNKSALTDHVIILSKVYRSSDDIVNLSSLINNGDHIQSLRYLENRSSQTVSIDSRDGLDSVRKWLLDWLNDDYINTLKSLRKIAEDSLNNTEHPEHKNHMALMDKAFTALDFSRILTLSHSGQRGRNAINNLAEELIRPQLEESGKTKSDKKFHGQPVIVTRNRYDLGLYNGDLGLIVRNSDGELKAVFRQKKQYYSHKVSHIPDLESAFAMTIHKAQGSEFDEVLLILPLYRSALLNRQIIYTGVTRAKKRVKVLGSPEILNAAINTRLERPGGIEL